MGQIIGLDSSIFIYLFEDHPEFAERAEAALSRIKNGPDQGVLSVIGMIEILTGPKRKGDFELAKAYKNLLRTFPNFTIAGINEQIVDLSSGLRAHYQITTPDAIHIATAIDFGANQFITNDKILQKVKEIPVVLLGSLVERKPLSS